MTAKEKFLRNNAKALNPKAKSLTCSKSQRIIYSPVFQKAHIQVRGQRSLLRC